MPAIPAPQTSIPSLYSAVQAIKQGVESLAGQRGSTLNRAVTFADLVRLKLVTTSALQSNTGTISTGGGSAGVELVQGTLVLEPTTLTLSTGLTLTGAGDNATISVSTSSGGITSLATDNGITGGPITTSGTISLAEQPPLTILANDSPSSEAVPTGVGISTFLDAVFGESTGVMLYRGATGWEALEPATNGDVLTLSAGEPAWEAAGGGAAVVVGPTFGMGGAFVRPRLSVLTQINSASGAWSEPFGANGPIVFSAPAGGSGSDNCLAMLNEAGDFEKYFLLEPQNVAAPYQSMGIAIGDGSGKLLLATFAPVGSYIQFLEFNSPTSYNNTYRQFNYNGDARLWYHVKWDGTTLLVEYSANSIKFDTIYSGAPFFISTPTQIGPYVSIQSSGSYPPNVTGYVWHFDDTVPTP
jgi:hypothetical protein